MHGDSGSTRWFCIELLGHFRVTENGAAKRTIRIRSRRGQALIAYLAMHPSRAIPRAKAAALLWEDQSEARSRHSLRQLLTELRDEIGPLFDAGIEKETLEFSSRIFKSDVSDFLEYTRKPGSTGTKSAAEIYTGELFDPGPVSSSYDDWISSERRKLHALALHVFETRIGHLIAGEGHREALSVCERLFTLDPLSEATHRRLISLEAEVNGAGSAAKRAKELALLLRKELGVSPEPQTAELLASLAANRTSVKATIARTIPVKSPNLIRRVAFAGAALACTAFLIVAVTIGLHKTVGEEYPSHDELVTLGFVEAAKTSASSEDKALSLFRKALAVNPDSASAKTGIGRVLLQRVYDLRSANRERDIAVSAEILSEAVKDAPNYIPALYFLSIARKNQGRFEESIALLEKVLRFNPRHANAHAQLGHALLFLGRAGETEQHIRKALAYSPKDEGLAIWYIFAGQADLHLARYAHAVEWLEKGLEIGPENPIGLALLAAAHVLQGENAKAAATAQKLRQQFPDFAANFIRDLHGGYTHPEFTLHRNKIIAAVQTALDSLKPSELSGQ